MRTEQPPGIVRRRIILIATENNVIVGVEDDFHHFELRLAHDGVCVTDIRCRALRTPLRICPEASARIGEVIGLPLSWQPEVAAASIDKSLHCTHQLDLALLAMTHALRGGRRQYDLVMPYPVDGKTSVTLIRDGDTVLNWKLADTRIVAPDPYAGRDLRSLLKWARSNLDANAYEAVQVLRRGVMVALRREWAVVNGESADKILDRIAGACFAYRLEHRGKLYGAKNGMRDFTNSPDALLDSFPSG